MRATIKSPTFWKGARLKAGDSVEIDETTAKRWRRAGIADVDPPQDPPGQDEPPQDPPVDPSQEPPQDPPTDPPQDPPGQDEPPQDGDDGEDQTEDDSASLGGAGSTMTQAALRRLNRAALERIAEKRVLDISAAQNNTERADMIFADINKE